jgi:hypothetical protein
MKARFALLTGALLLASCGGQSGGDAPKADYVRAHDIKQLMAVVVQPQADGFWGSSGYVSDENGERDLTPTTDEGWLKAQSSAATVTEVGNLLMTPLYTEGRGEDWIKFSKALVEIGQRAEAAVIARDSQAMFDIGATMYNVCSACHQAYPPAEGEIPEGNASNASNAAQE